MVTTSLQSKRIVIGFTVVLERSVGLLQIDEIKKAIESIPGVAAVEESSIPIQIPMSLV